MSTEPLTITLTKDEALVLFDWLGRFNEKSQQGVFEDQAEEQALFNLEATLERILVEPFAPNYRELVQKARERVRAPSD